MRTTSGWEQTSIGMPFRYAWTRSRGSLSLLLVWICAGLFLGVKVMDLLRIMPQRETLALLGLSHTGLVVHKYLFQIVTAPLLHTNLAHLVFNMLSLWMLGPEVEQRMGRYRYALFSALCAAAGMLGFLLFNWNTGHFVIGYSGVIFGLLVCQATYFPDNRVAIFGFFMMKMKYAVLLLGAVELYLSIIPEDGGIAHASHLFGAVAAFIYLRLLGGPNRKRPNRIAPPAQFISKEIRNMKRRMDMPREL